ncbi:MAG: YciI family protein [Sporichthyaceae bacterium]|nr:YciI family protein [Sporichthyaceae bacterium]
MKYVILIVGDESKYPTDDAESEAWMNEIVAWYDKWTQAGKIVDDGAELDSPTKAKTIRSTGVTDGPYIEAKEAIGGFSTLETDTIEEAVEIASGWPGVSNGLITIEVRPVLER